MRIELKLPTDDGNEEATVTIVRESSGGIAIGFEGYGTHDMEPGHGFPIFIEFHEGYPRIYVWSDIRDSDVTHVIDLDTTHEKFRVADEPEEETESDSGPCPHYEDNQGFCHKCGILMNEDWARQSGYFQEGMVEGK
jgi:hypothetical protein